MDRIDDTVLHCDEIHPARETVLRLKNAAVLARNEEIRKEGDTYIRKEVEHIDALNQVLNTHRNVDTAPSPESVDDIVPANKGSRTIRQEGERRSSSSDESESIIPPSLSGRAKRGSAEMERRDVKDKSPPIPWMKWFCGIGENHSRAEYEWA
jgi:hypothetical protein